jgi:hypothetical protein
MWTRAAAVRFLSEASAAWSRVTLGALIRPLHRFERASAVAPMLLSLSALNVLLSIALNGVLFDRVSIPQLVSAVFILFIFWFAYCSALHGAYRLVRGAGRYEETLGVSLQTLAAVYAVASLLAFVTEVLVVFPTVARAVNRLPGVGEGLVRQPAMLLWFLATAALLFYLPIRLKPLHAVGWWRATAVLLVAFLVFEASFSGCGPPPRKHGMEYVAAVLIPGCGCGP